jgi:hypothetical protein
VTAAGRLTSQDQGAANVVDVRAVGERVNVPVIDPDRPTDLGDQCVYECLQVVHGPGHSTMSTAAPPGEIIG